MHTDHRSALIRSQSIWHSFRNLPLWMQAWALLVLMPVNACALLFLGHFSGQAIALALLVVVTVNVTLMWRHGGVNKDMSLVHLVAWIPLQIALLGQLAGFWGEDVLSFPVWVLTVTVLMVNAVTLFFDLVDAWCWVQGDRLTLHPDTLSAPKGTPRPGPHC